MTMANTDAQPKRSSVRSSVERLFRKRQSGPAAAAEQAKLEESTGVQPVVLPSYVVPTQYDLTLTPNLGGDFNFEGVVDIDLNLHKAGLHEITLHAFELELQESWFVDDTGSVSVAREFVYDKELSTVCIKFVAELAPGSGMLHVSFTGVHNNEMAGFYRSEYTDAKGEKQLMLSTQFEALSARRCFPCVDEPAAKAVFQATLIVDAKFTALANMPESSSECIRSPNGKLKKVTFQPTPLMSTYLLAFCVGEFDYVSAVSDHGVLIRVYTPPTKREQGYFALDAGKRCLDLYDDTFGTPYPLPKLDMIAIPEFSAGAMENWGLVTYRETMLLIDDKASSSYAKQMVCIVVAHELAHQVRIILS
jgi:aminopeptidase N